MSNTDIIRAWKDKDYRNSLSEDQRRLLTENPAGTIELSDESIMENLKGGIRIDCKLCCGSHATVQRQTKETELQSAFMGVD